VTGRTKKYLKIGVGGLLILGLFKRPLFYPWNTQQEIAANVTSIALLILALCLLYSAGRQRTDDT
jgi:hypothetical protein